MTVKEMERLTKHFDTHFEQSDSLVLHPIIDYGYHVDVLLYKPSKKYPFWKLVTMGASDYKMPKAPNTIGLFNEYIMFVDKDENLDDMDTVNWYRKNLVMIASFAKEYNTHITYGHSFEWKKDSPEDEMVAAYIDFPQVIPNVKILHCKINPFKQVACLQVVLLNEAELDVLKKVGPQAFSEFLYPENGERAHFLSEKHRTERF